MAAGPALDGGRTPAGGAAGITEAGKINRAAARAAHPAPEREFRIRDPVHKQRVFLFMMALFANRKLSPGR
jgi:hypothetical protein